MKLSKRKLAGVLALSAFAFGAASSAATLASLVEILNTKSLSEAKKEDKLSGYTAAMNIAEKICDVFANDNNNLNIANEVKDVLGKLIKNRQGQNYNMDVAIGNNADVKSVMDGVGHREEIGRLINLAAKLDVEYEDVINALINDVTVDVVFEDTLKTNQAVDQALEDGMLSLRVDDPSCYIPLDEEIERYQIDPKKRMSISFGNTEKYNDLFKNNGPSDFNRIKILNKLGYEYSSLLNNSATRTVVSLGVAEALFLLIPASLPTAVMALLGWGVCGAIGNRVANTVIHTFDPSNPTHLTYKEAFISSITPDEYSVNKLAKELVTYTIGGSLNLTGGAEAATKLLGEISKTALRDRIGDFLVRKGIQAGIGKAGGFVSSYLTDKIVDKLEDFVGTSVIGGELQTQEAIEGVFNEFIAEKFK